MIAFLDYLRGNPGQMIASGKNDDVTFTRIYRYLPSAYGECNVANATKCEDLKMMVYETDSIREHSLQCIGDFWDWGISNWPESVICE